MTGPAPLGGVELPEVLEPPPVTAPATARQGNRRRAWLLAAAVVLVVLTYLTLWSTYAAIHTGDRYRQPAPGASATRSGADFRVLSLVRTERLADQEGGDPQVADAGTVFVVAVLEMVQRQPTSFVNCSDLDLLGPGGRVWEPITTDVQRQEAHCDSDEVEMGRPYRYETVYLVPVRDVDGVTGVALVDVATPRRTDVLRPRA